MLCNYESRIFGFSSGPSNCSDGDVRLMGGENELEGRVIMEYGEQSATMAGMNEMQLLSVTSLELDN